MDLLINGANLLYVAAYFTTDILRLRILTTIAAISLSIYFATQPVPLLNVVAWNLFFAALNLVQLLRILRRRRLLALKGPTRELAPAELTVRGTAPSPPIASQRAF